MNPSKVSDSRSGIAHEANLTSLDEFRASIVRWRQPPPGVAHHADVISLHEFRDRRAAKILERQPQVMNNDISQARLAEIKLLRDISAAIEALPPLRPASGQQEQMTPRTRQKLATSKRATVDP